MFKFVELINTTNIRYLKKWVHSFIMLLKFEQSKYIDVVSNKDHPAIVRCILSR